MFTISEAKFHLAVSFCKCSFIIFGGNCLVNKNQSDIKLIQFINTLFVVTV